VKELAGIAKALGVTMDYFMRAPCDGDPDLFLSIQTQSAPENAGTKHLVKMTDLRRSQ
jgi:hypothetical protein